MSEFGGLPAILAKDDCRIGEVWDPGYAAQSGQYRRLRVEMAGCVGTPPEPLEDIHVPAAVSGKVDPFSIDTLPEVTFTVLHSRKAATRRPEGVNLSSIVLKIEVDGVTLLFPSDAMGKQTYAASSKAPIDTEAALLEIEKRHPGTLRSDVLIAPFSGSESSSTDAFIRAVAPRIVIFAGYSAHPYGMPKDSVADRYAMPGRRLFRTKLDKRSGHEAFRIHIDDDLEYEPVDWTGRLADGTVMDTEVLLKKLDAATAEGSMTRGVFRGADLSGAPLGGSDLQGLDLTGANLRGLTLTQSELDDMRLSSTISLPPPEGCRRLCAQHCQGSGRAAISLLIDGKREILRRRHYFAAATPSARLVLAISR